MTNKIKKVAQLLKLEKADYKFKEDICCADRNILLQMHREDIGVAYHDSVYPNPACLPIENVIASFTDIDMEQAMDILQIHGYISAEGIWCKELLDAGYVIPHTYTHYLYGGEVKRIKVVTYINPAGRNWLTYFFQLAGFIH
ncbi:MAG: hypothetical protein NVSMB45_01090 [Ginsengibacter sp.]